MPCCGLHEYQVKAPFRLMVCGGVVFWGFFLISLLVGLALVWLPVGRRILRVNGGFVAALWRETMRRDDSLPSRWSCRLSGRLLPLSPRLAAWVFHHPEVPCLYVPLAGLATLVFAGVALARAL